MNTSSARVPFLLLGLLAAACSSDRGGDDGDGGSTGDCDFLAGDLVITEVMANPTGTDTGQEYFEVYNASSETIDASGLGLVYSLPDGENEETHEVDGLTIEAGAYVALGTADPAALPDFIGYGFANDLGALRNGGALLALRCGDEEIDSIEYASAEGEDGVAWSLDGAIAPDHLVNDDPENFCGATTEFAEGMFGTPGEANESCTPAVVPGSCTGEDGERDVVLPVVGDLVISEHMASPNGTDDVREWFEVYAATDVDLNGLTARRDDGEPEALIETADCVSLAGGEYAVFARSADAGENGGLPEVAGTFGFTMVADAVISIGVGEEALDQVTLTPVTNNASTALDPEALDPTENDDVANWFACEAPYGNDTKRPNTGTPGASNETCGDTDPPPPPPDSCNDGGTPRPIVSPAAGEIRITEAFANATTVGGDVNREWFEVRALADFDLNGLGFNEDDGNEVELTVESPDCLSVSSGDLILFARNADAGANGNLPAVDQTFGFTLNDSSGRLFVSLGGTILDELLYGTAATGRSRQIDAEGTICSTPETVPYSPEGDLGTPGDANPACP